MSGSRPAKTNDTKDSALDSTSTETKAKISGKDAPKKEDDPKGNPAALKENTSKRNTRGKKPEASSTKQTPGFSEGNNVLNSYGLSVSGRKERILSTIKTDKYFHFVEQSWQQLVQLKPHLTERFSLAEFRHTMALALYQRIENVKFDQLGVKPSAPTRIPLPRSLRLFQPLWSVLANIGTVDDDELRVTYIPDSWLPETDDLSSEKDIQGLISCCLYDWTASWNDVLEARSLRPSYQERLGVVENVTSNETNTLSGKALVDEIARTRRNVIPTAQQRETSGKYKIIDGKLYKYPLKKDVDKEFDAATVEDLNLTASNSEMKKTPGFTTVKGSKEYLETLMSQARNEKKRMITPIFDVSFSPSSYRLSDGEISADAGAYGARLHWDPKLWLEYEQFVEIVTPVAMFSLSMPAETTGTYAWILPVEKREKDDSSVSARLPKASIPPVTWVLALLLQSSTLPLLQRSTFYVETDRLQNVIGLRQKYIRAAIKDPAAVEQYGTY